MRLYGECGLEHECLTRRLRHHHAWRVFYSVLIAPKASSHWPGTTQLAWPRADAGSLNVASHATLRVHPIVL